MCACVQPFSDVGFHEIPLEMFGEKKRFLGNFWGMQIFELVSYVVIDWEFVRGEDFTSSQLICIRIESLLACY